MLIWWNNQRQMAARLVADGTMTSAKIAAQVGISPKTLATWKANPVFRERVVEITRAYADEILQDGISAKEHRLQLLQARHDALERIIEKRAADPDMRSVPGGTTGFVKRRDRIFGRGHQAIRITDYTIDHALLRHMSAIEKQAAQEMGQWNVPPSHVAAQSPAGMSNINFYKPGEEPEMSAES